MRNALVCLFGGIALLLQAVDGRAYTITVDGSAADWGLAPQPTINNIGQIARDTSNRGVFAWKDLANDYASYSDSDITYFYTTADATYLYFLIRMQNIAVASGLSSPAVQIAIDRAAGGSTAFCLLDTPISTSASAAYEYIVFAFGGANQLRVGSVCGTTLAGNMSISTANDLIEIRVPWANIGGAPAVTGSKLRFTVLAGRTKDNGQPTSVEFNTDAISNCGHPATAGCSTATELADADVDYFFDVWFRLGSGGAYEPFPPAVISEVYPAAGAAANQQWVEIFNTSNTNLTLTGFRIGDSEAIGDAEAMYSFPAGATIPNGNAQVVAADATAYNAVNLKNPKYELYGSSSLIQNLSIDTTWSIAPRTFDLLAASDEVLLLDDRFTIIDAVAYGANWSNIVSIGAPAAGNSIERTGVYRDTDNCVSDFGVGLPTPNTPQGTCADAAGNLGNTRACSNGNPCTTDTCNGSGACVTGAARSCPSDGIACTQDSCDGDYGGCYPPEPAGAKPSGCTDSTPNDCVDAACNGAGACNQSYGFEASSYACSDTVANDCWTARCSGTDATCVQSGSPAVPIGAGTQCTDTSTTDCYDARCDGSTGCIQNYAFELATYVCRASGGVCDVADSCDGVTGGCPGDVKVGAGTACTADANPCTLDQCDGVNNACQHPAGNAGTVCNASTGVCDPAESCTGSSTTCPANVYLPNGTACTSDGNPCTLDQCNGVAGACQHPAGNGGTICNASTGICDPAETCTGSSTVCPANVLSPNGTACPADGNPCTLDQCNGASALCQHPAGNAGTVCLAAAGECDLAETCTGSSTACPADAKRTSGTACTADSNPCTLDQCDGSNNACQHPAGNAGTVCLAAAGECDLAETCTGSSTVCPADVKKGAGTACTADSNPCTLDQCDGSTNGCQHPAGNAGAECRASAGTCDPRETCTGSSATCPTDAKSTAQCRASAGVCDPAEICTGTSNDCPADAKSTAQCRGSAGVCDPAEACDGTNNACPTDLKSTAECRALQGECDVAESCDGSGNDCPADAKHGSGFACTLDGNPCSLDQCDGTSDTCQHPAGHAGAVCRAEVAGGCDVQEVCTGSSTVCPTDVVVAFATPCLDEGNACTLDLCDGVNPACQHPAGNSGAMCRPAASICDQAEYCDGSAVCPTDLVLSSSALCRAAAGPCDVDDFCDGVNGPCIDSKQPTTLECRATTGVCDPVEFCDGVDNACPTDVKSVDVCRDAVGVCDAPEFCDGNNGDCPIDAKLDSTSTCRDVQGECDRAETCDSVSDDCPVDGKRTDVCRPAIGDCDLAENCDGIGNSCPADQLAPVTTACDDQNPCTGGTHCNGAGICVAETVTCDAGTNDAAADGGTLDAVGVDTARYDASVRRDSAHSAAPIDSPDGCGCVATTASRGPLGALVLLGGLLALRRRSNRR